MTQVNWILNLCMTNATHAHTRAGGVGVAGVMEWVLHRNCLCWHKSHKSKGLKRRGRGNEQRKKLPTINVTPSNICACVCVCGCVRPCVCGTPLAASYQSVDAVTNWKCQANGQSDWQTYSVTHWLIEWIWDWMTGKRLAGRGNRRVCECSWGSKSKSAQTVMETTNTCAFSQQLPKNRNNCAE